MPFGNINNCKIFNYNKRFSFSSGLLEQYKSSIVMGFSYYKLFSSSRLCVRVRRSSDNAQQDFGFIGNYIDSAGILAFCGSGSGFVSIWYNQCTGGIDAVKVINANQPRIVNNGVFETDGVRFIRALFTLLEFLAYDKIKITNPPYMVYTNYYATTFEYIFSINDNSGAVKTCLSLTQENLTANYRSNHPIGNVDVITSSLNNSVNKTLLTWKFDYFREIFCNDSYAIGDQNSDINPIYHVSLGNRYITGQGGSGGYSNGNIKSIIMFNDYNTTIFNLLKGVV